MVLGFKLWNCQGQRNLIGYGVRVWGAGFRFLPSSGAFPKLGSTFQKRVPLKRVIRVPIAKVKYHTGVHTGVHKRNTIYRRLNCVYPNIDGPHYSTVPTVGFRLQYGPLPGPKK